MSRASLIGTNRAHRVRGMPTPWMARTRGYGPGSPFGPPEITSSHLARGSWDEW